MPNDRAVEKSSVHYIKEGEQTERWRKEFIQKKEYEVNLAAVSKLSYEEVDYAPFLESAEFPTLVLNNYDHLYGQAVRTIETKYFIPISIRIALFFGLGIFLIVFFSMTTLAVITILSGMLAASLFHTKKEKAQALKTANEMVAAEIRKRHEEEKSVYQEAKENYESAERERIESIKSLLEGRQSSIGARLLECFKLMTLPVLVEIDIEYYNNIPLAKVWLPSKAVIPQQTCEMLPSGRIQYKDKELRVFNKQYFELCTAIVMQVTLTILGNIPSFEYCYAWGLIKGDDADECLIAVSSNKENAAYAGRVGSAFNALQLLETLYDADTNFMLRKVEPAMPPEWGDVEQKDIYSIRIKIFK